MKQRSIPAGASSFPMMTAEEVKAFWEGFCERRGISADVIAKGNARIEEDPEYWADQTMATLLDLLVT